MLIIYNRELHLRNDMLELSKEYCNQRISKTNNRDKDQIERYHRIYNEILPWFDQNVSERKNTIFSIFLDYCLSIFLILSISIHLKSM